MKKGKIALRDRVSQLETSVIALQNMNRMVMELQISYLSLQNRVKELEILTTNFLETKKRINNLKTSNIVIQDKIGELETSGFELQDDQRPFTDLKTKQVFIQNKVNNLETGVSLQDHREYLETAVDSVMTRAIFDLKANLKNNLAFNSTRDIQAAKRRSEGLDDSMLRPKRAQLGSISKLPIDLDGEEFGMEASSSASQIGRPSRAARSLATSREVEGNDIPRRPDFKASSERAGVKSSKHGIIREKTTRTRCVIDKHAESAGSEAEDIDIFLQLKNVIPGSNPEIFTLKTIGVLRSHQTYQQVYSNKPNLPNYTNQSTPNS